VIDPPVSTPVRVVSRANDLPDDTLHAHGLVKLPGGTLIELDAYPVMTTPRGCRSWNVATGISFGHFNIVGGVVREDGPYVGVIEDRTPAETLADLYVGIAPARPGSEVVCPELLHLIAGQFGRPQYSLTGNLLQSLRAAQEHLRAWNKTAPPERQACEMKLNGATAAANRRITRALSKRMFMRAPWP